MNLKKLIFLMTILLSFYIYGEGEKGIKIITESVDHINNQKASGVLLIAGEKIRVDTDDEGDQSIIYDLEKKEVTIINHKEKSWIKLTKKQIDDSKAQIKAHMDMIIEQQKAALQGLSEEQRKQVEAQMKEIMGETESVPVKYIKTGKKEKWNDLPCILYDGMSGKVKTEELCTVMAKDLKCSVDELDKLRQISTDFAINDQEGISAWNNIKELGVPVVHRAIENNKTVFTNTLVSFEKVEVPKDKFSVPSKYKEIQMPSLDKEPEVKAPSPAPEEKKESTKPEKEKKKSEEKK